MTANGATDTTKQIKELLSDPKYRIQLHDLVHEETERVYKILSDWETQVSGNIEELVKERVAQAEAETENLRRIFAYGCFFGLEDQNELWCRSLNRLGTLPFSSGSTYLIDLQTYPALLVLYVGGVSAVASNRYYNLAALLSSKVKTATHGQQPLVLRANCTMLGQGANSLLGFERRKTPLSDHLNDLLQKSIPTELIHKPDFDLVFDKWEILLGMAVSDALRNRPTGSWAPPGAFSWRDEHADDRALKVVETELQEEGKSWGPLAAGLFGSSVDRANEAFSTVKQIADKVAGAF